MEALFDGKIIPWERRNAYSAERIALEKAIESEKQYFRGKMSLEDRRRFEALENLFSDAAYDEEVEIYSHGFTLGALLMLEVTAKEKSVVNT